MWELGGDQKYLICLMVISGKEKYRVRDIKSDRKTSLIGRTGADTWRES